MNDPIRILLVDDSPHFLAALHDFLEYQTSISVAGMAAGEEEALAQAQALQPDVILLDLNLGDISGLSLIPFFKERAPAAKIIVLTMMEEGGYRAAALQAGADGFVHKSVMSTALVAAILEAMQPGTPGAIPVHGNPAPARVARPTIDLQRLAEHLPDLVYRYELTPARGFSYVSPSATAMTGYTPEEHYADPDLGFRLVHPDDHPLLDQMAQGEIESPNPVELRWVRKDGAILWTEQLNVKILDEAGEVVAIEGVARDITWRKVAAEALRESEVEYRRIVETAQEGIWLIDAENKTTFVNARMAEMLGYSVDEMMGSPLFSFMDEDGRGAAHQYLERRRKGMVEQHDFRFQRKDGSGLWALLATNPIFDINGSYAGALAMVSDITERKRAEMSLKSSEENYRSLVETADSAVAVLDREGTIRYANPATVRIWEDAQIVGKGVAELFPTEIAERYLSIVQHVIDDQVGHMNELETEVRGRTMWFRVSLSPLKNPDGSVDALLLSAIDMTGYKRTEEALRRRENELQTLIENSPDAITRFDREGRYVLVNSKRAANFGLPREAILGRNWRDLLGPEDEAEAAIADQVFRRTMDERVEQTVEYETSTPLGKRWVQSRAVPEPAKDGSVETILVVTRDITERKQAEAALLNSERFVQETLNALTASVAILDETGVIIAVNRPWRAFAQESGIDPALVSEGVNYLAVCDTAKGNNADEAPVIGSCIRAVMRGEEESCAVEYPCHSPDEERWFVAHITKFKGEGPVRVVVAHENITARKLSEQAVAASEARYRELFQANPHAMWVYDLETLRFLAVNDTAIFRYGYSRDEFLAMTLADIRPAEEVPDLMRNVATESATVQNSGGWKHRLKDGRLIDVEISSHALDIDGRAARLVLASDVTERKRAEAALHASEERFRVTFEQAAVGIAHVATSGRWLRVNQRLCEITGYARDELLSRSFQDITHPDDLDVDLEHVRQMLADEIQTYSLEKRYIRKEGSIVWILLTVSLLRNEQGTPEYFISVVQDISNRKQSEESLRQSEVRYRALFEQSNDAVFILDLQGNHVQANRRAAEMLGYTPEELLTLSYAQISAQAAQSEEVLAQLLMGTPRPTYESEFRRKTGDVFPVEINVELVRDDDDNPLHIQSVVRDITERKQAAATLHLQGSALEAAANAIVITDASGTIEWVNSAWTRLTGYTVTEAIGRNPRILASGRQDRSFYEHLWKTILAGASWHGELTNRRRDGSLYEEEQTITPIADQTGRITHFIGIKQDITGRRQAEEQIRRQVERLAALRAIDQTILSNVDLQVNLSYLLAQVPGLLGVDAAAILLVNHPQNVLELAAGIGFDMDAVRGASFPLTDGPTRASGEATAHMSRPSSDGEGAFLGTMLRAEGFVSYADVPLNVKGSIVGVMEVYSRTAQEHDAAWFDFLSTLAGQAAIAVENARLSTAAQRELVERRRAEADLRTLNRELEERVEERTADLKRLNLELERALRVKDEFLANMSHELRTPLTAIISMSELLEMQIVGPLNEKQQKYVATVGENGAHLLALINDILDIAKSEAGQLKLCYDMVDPQATCDAARRMVIQLAQQKGHNFALEVDENLGLVWADGRRLKQMLVNLLSNAVKFTPQGGSIGLTVRRDHERNEIAFTVWDTGIGIRGEDMPRLFRPFVQLDSHGAHTATGTGLGLALVAQMAQLHGGSVDVTSEVGVGSRFTITLPWVSPQTEEVPSGADEPAEAGTSNPVIAARTGTILLVEDSESIVTALSEYLDHVGYRVAVARNGVEGIAQARQIRPDLILMDVRMAELDGLETTRRLRREPGFLTTPIIALTAHAMESDRAQCLAAGMDDYLSKPVDLLLLLRTIERFLAD